MSLNSRLFDFAMTETTLSSITSNGRKRTSRLHLREKRRTFKSRDNLRGNSLESNGLVTNNEQGQRGSYAQGNEEGEAKL